MLDDNKKLFEQYANNVIPGWKSKSKNELCNLYIENESDESKKNAYFGAIICKYWNLISKFYSYSYNVASPEDAYDWLTSSIMYALEHRSWKNPKSSIYNDPNGPDKVINRCMKCRRFTYYQALNRQKRKDGVMVLSLDKIQEDYADNTDYIEDEGTTDETSTVAVKAYIRKLFSEGDVLASVIIDMIINGDLFKSQIHDGVSSPVEFSTKYLILDIKRINDEYYERFASDYDLDYDFVKSSIREYKNKYSDGDYRKEILNKFNQLKYYSWFTDMSSKHNLVDNLDDWGSVNVVLKSH